jgi:hypothetical protein
MVVSTCRNFRFFGGQVALDCQMHVLFLLDIGADSGNLCTMRVPLLVFPIKGCVISACEAG